MWVEGGDVHDELLGQLGGVLAPPADLELTPSVAELEALAERLPLERVNEAFVALVGRAVAGKIVLDLGSSGGA